MELSHMQLHSENFDLCRICLFEPESDRNRKFVKIFQNNNEGINLKQVMLELLKIDVKENDVKPKIVCEICYKSLLRIIEGINEMKKMKKKGDESQIVIKYVEEKKFSGYMPGVDIREMNQSSSNDFALPSTSRNIRQLTNVSHSFTRSQKTLRISNASTSTIQINHYGSLNGDQDNSTQLLNTNPSNTSDDDDDDDDDDDNDEDNDKLYCSICKMDKKYNHDCYKFNKKFSTCLIPYCNIICRSLYDLMPHYEQHVGLTNDTRLCNYCFEKCTNFDNHFCLKFKCHSCDIMFNTMRKLATHKLKVHRRLCQLIDFNGKFLCLYCEESTSELTEITEHIKHHENQRLYQIQRSTKQRKSKIIKKTLTVSKTKKSPLFRTSDNKLYTCLKPSCNLILPTFKAFKLHHRLHYGIKKKFLMCWQCCSQHRNLSSLRIHQKNSNCRIVNYKCYECNKEHADIQNLSIHKYTEHDGNLIYKNRKTMNCIYCSFVIDIKNFKNHLIQCQFQNQRNENISNSRQIQNTYHSFNYEQQFSYATNLES